MPDDRRARTHPDCPGAIERNRAALLRIVAVLFVYAGLDEGGADEVPRRVWRMILRLLRPAKSAARRLVVIAARGIDGKPPKSRVDTTDEIGYLDNGGILQSVLRDLAGFLVTGIKTWSSAFFTRQFATWLTLPPSSSGQARG